MCPWLDPMQRTRLQPPRPLHLAAGVPVMLTDFGLAERWHRGLVWTLMGIGLIIFLYFALRHA